MAMPTATSTDDAKVGATDPMIRIWIIAGLVMLDAVVLGLSTAWLGMEVVEGALPVLALTLGAVLLPGGTTPMKAVMLVGGLAVGFVWSFLASDLWPGRVAGDVLAIIGPVLICAVVLCWSRSITYFVSVVFGVAAYGSIALAFTAANPHSLGTAFSGAFCVAIIPMAVTFTIFSLALEVAPNLMNVEGQRR